MSTAPPSGYDRPTRASATSNSHGDSGRLSDANWDPDYPAQGGLPSNPGAARPLSQPQAQNGPARVKKSNPADRPLPGVPDVVHRNEDDYDQAPRPGRPKRSPTVRGGSSSRRKQLSLAS